MQDQSLEVRPEMDGEPGQYLSPGERGPSRSWKTRVSGIWSWTLRAQFVVLVSVATYLSLIPKPGAVFEASPDKFLHLLCWGVLLVSLWLACGVKGFRLWMVPALFGYSILVEIGQIWVPNRFFSWGDILANGCGILLGWLGVWLASRVTGSNHF